MTKPYKLLRDKMTKNARESAQRKTDDMLKDIYKNLKHNTPKKTK